MANIFIMQAIDLNLLWFYKSVNGRGRSTSNPPKPLPINLQQSCQKGFGKQYVITYDLKFEDINKPIKRSFSLRLSIAIANALVVIIIFREWLPYCELDKDSSKYEKGSVSLAAYIGYLLWIYCKACTYQYLNNMKIFAGYWTTFRTMHLSRG